MANSKPYYAYDDEVVSHRSGEEPIFDPVSEELLQKYESHYDKFPDFPRASIREAVYGGRPLEELLPQPSIRMFASDGDAHDLRATIAVRSNGVDALVLHRISLKQFLIAGLSTFKDGRGAPEVFDGKDYWSDYDAQSRLELAHTETWRWSLHLKRDGLRLGDLDANQIQQFPPLEGREILDIVLVNNCTTAYGFEIRLTVAGVRRVSYHGSYGKEKKLDRFYRYLSKLQSGSWAKQESGLTGPGLPFGWGGESVYGSSNGWGPGQNRMIRTLSLDMKRYRVGTGVEREHFGEFQPSTGDIAYDRWGESSEYFQKSKRRHLMLSIEYESGTPTHIVPNSYSDVKRAVEIVLPNFGEDGVYHIESRQPKRGHRWLYDLTRFVLRTRSNGLNELEILASEESNLEARLLRIVFGNLDLRSVPVYRPDSPEGSFMTVHRFGYGARDTDQFYNSRFRAPHGSEAPAPYAFLLAGDSDDASDAHEFICPEAFGVERALFSFADEQRTRLTIDLMSFERILPLWQATFEVPNGFFDRHRVWPEDVTAHDVS